MQALLSYSTGCVFYFGGRLLLCYTGVHLLTFSMQLYTTTLGSGPPLVILHGLFGTGENWLSIAKKLAPYFTIYLPDLRNHGKSFHADRHDYTALSDDLRAWCDHHQLSRFSMIGHSMGGKAAMVFTLRYPEMINRLIVADMAPIDYNDSYTDQLEKSIAVMRKLDLTGFTSRDQILAAMREELDDRRMVGFFVKNIKKDKQTNHFYWQCNLPVFQRHIPIIRGSLEEYRPAVPCPTATLFLYGGDSPYQVSEYRQESCGFFPNALFEAVQNAGHWLHSDQPEIFCQAALRFLAASSSILQK